MSNPLLAFCTLFSSLLHSSQKINVAKNEVNTFLNDAKKQGKKIAGFGAPAKATTLMYHFEFTSSLIDFIVDDSPLKQGRFSPGMHIPIVSYSSDEKPDVYIVFAFIVFISKGMIFISKRIIFNF